ncbi:NAC domain-containing protein 83-like [Musa acuminata AAA Group]|uniref:NAC domain-containing protein 83-like n=1 Tax=Musa acuminata AAA Group TaxID=214697 RepID=UPI0031D4E27E
MEAVDDVPRGYRFLPTAEELVDYLVRWINNETPLPCRALEFADVYGTEPWHLLGNNRQEGYFFTERKPKYSTSLCVNRKAGEGSWRAYKKEKLVDYIVDGYIARVQKTRLSFNDGRRKNSGWTMYEYAMCSSDGGLDRRVLWWR